MADISNSEYLPFLLDGNIDINQEAANKGGTTIIRPWHNRKPVMPGTFLIYRDCKEVGNMKRRLRVYKKTVSIVNETATAMYENLVGDASVKHLAERSHMRKHCSMENSL